MFTCPRFDCGSGGQQRKWVDELQRRRAFRQMRPALMQQVIGVRPPNTSRRSPSFIENQKEHRRVGGKQSTRFHPPIVSLTPVRCATEQTRSLAHRVIPVEDDDGLVGMVIPGRDQVALHQALAPTPIAGDIGACRFEPRLSIGDASDTCLYLSCPNRMAQNL